MENLRKYRNQILKYTAVFAAMFWIISIPFTGICGSFLVGLLLGTFVTGLNFMLLELTLEKIAEMEEQDAKRHILKNYIMRTLLYGIFFFFCWKIGRVAAIGCIAGLFTTKVAIYIDGFQNQERK